jgi:hypothetical protein
VSRPPPPRASPRPHIERPDDDRRARPVARSPTPASRIHQYEYLKDKLGELDEHFEDTLKKHDNKLTWRSVAVAISAVGAGVVASILFIDNRVRAETDAGVAVMTEKHEALKVRVETLEKRFDRFDQKLDLVLDAQRVPQWKRPPPMDGGKP